MLSQKVNLTQKKMKQFNQVLLLIFLLFINVQFVFSQIEATLPEPTGTHKIGSTSFYWIDSTRLDTITNVAFSFLNTSELDTILSKQLNAYRQMAVRIWYPADVNGSHQKAFYLPYLTAQKERPEFYEARLRNYQNVNTHTYQNAPIKKGVFPVILFSTGRGTNMAYYTTLAEEFASLGYVFVGISSAHATHIGLKDAFIPALSRWRPPFSIYDPSFERADAFFEEANEIVSKDMIFVLKKLEELNQGDSFFNRKFKMNQIGFMGHSLGGMAGARACKQSKKCKAFFSIEAVASKDVRASGLEVPSGLLVSELSISQDNNNYRPLYMEITKARTADFHLFTVLKGGHNSFSDLPIIASQQFNYEIDALEGIAIGRKVCVGFFDKFLLGKKVKLDQLADGFDLVSYRRY